MAKPELVVTTGSFYPTSTRDALSRITRLGFNHVEVTVQNLELDYNFHKQVRLHHFEELRNLIRKLELQVTSLHAPSLSSVQAFSHRARNEIVLKCLDIAALLRGDEVVVHPHHAFRSYEACSFFSEESPSIEKRSFPA